MSNYIEREAVIQALCGECGLCEIGECDHDCDDLINIKHIPAADVKPVVGGEWIFNQYDADPKIGNWHCSACQGISIERRSRFLNYCPNCGADMRGGKNGDI